MKLWNPIKKLYVSQVRRNLESPEKSWMGWITQKYIFKKNKYLEENAARLCKISRDHKVLELGFGTGRGLTAALQHIQDGPGKVYGVDISPYIVELALSKFSKQISDGQLEIAEGDVHYLPFNSNMFDRVFHCNCYIFWTDMPIACFELYRVMKPWSLMITTLNIDRMKINVKRGNINKLYYDPLRYMSALEAVGFQNVRIEYLDDNGKPFQAIYAEVKQKKEYVINDDD